MGEIIKWPQGRLEINILLKKEVTKMARKTLKGLFFYIDFPPWAERKLSWADL